MEFGLNQADFVVVADIDEPAFEPRDVTIRKDFWVTDEFEILDFLGR